jgi:hypothetical protein
VSTPSLAALQAYTKGVHELTLGNMPAAIGLLGQALTLDPNFAMAYARRGTAKWNVANGPAATASVADADADYTQAYQRRDRVSALERFYITTIYEQNVTGDILQSERDFQTWEQTYPNDPLPHINASVGEVALGQFAAALADNQIAYRSQPDNIINAIDLVYAEAAVGQATAATAEMDKQLAQHPESVYVHGSAYTLADWYDDAAGMARAVSWLASRPGAAEDLHQAQAGTAVRLGQLRRFRQLAGATTGLAAMEAVLGDAAGASRDVDATFRLLPAERADEVSLAAGVDALALAGDTGRAEALAAVLAQRFPQNTLANEVDLPVAHATIDLDRHQPQAAITALEPALPYEFGSNAQEVPAYMRGLAYMELKQPAAAAAEFKKITDFPLHVAITDAALLGLARAQVMAGDRAAARATYATLLASWKNADPLPAVLAARAEAAALR